VLTKLENGSGALSTKDNVCELPMEGRNIQQPGCARTRRRAEGLGQHTEARAKMGSPTGFAWPDSQPGDRRASLWKQGVRLSVSKESRGNTALREESCGNKAHR